MRPGRQMAPSTITEDGGEAVCAPLGSRQGQTVELASPHRSDRESSKRTGGVDEEDRPGRFGSRPKS